MSGVNTTQTQPWLLRGTFIECCRVQDGHCALWLGRDLPHACVNMATYRVREGHIQGVDMAGVVLVYHQDGIGPSIDSLSRGIKEGAVYIGDRVSARQGQILESFVRQNLGIRPWGELLGVKFTDIQITDHQGGYQVTMPFGQQRLSPTTGGDGKNPIEFTNPRSSTLTNVQLFHTDEWTYHDYGKSMNFANTSGAVAEFSRSG